MYLSPMSTPRERNGSYNSNTDDVIGVGDGSRDLSAVLVSNSNAAPHPDYLPTLVSSSSDGGYSQVGEEKDRHHNSNRSILYVPILAIRRQRIGDEERYNEDAAIVDICLTHLDAQGNIPKIVNEEDDEDEEEEFSRRTTTLYQIGVHDDILKKTPWTPSSSSSDYTNIKNQTKSTTQYYPNNQQPIIPLLRHNIPFGFTDLPFPTKVLDRFPIKNYPNLPFPEEELPMFCYANGSPLIRRLMMNGNGAGNNASGSGGSCGKVLYGFVVKNERGDSIYGM